VNGKVRFFRGNLKATYDFAKKAAHVARTTLAEIAGLLLGGGGRRGARNDSENGDEADRGV
jgi:hypothetical protein